VPPLDRLPGGLLTPPGTAANSLWPFGPLAALSTAVTQMPPCLLPRSSGARGLRVLPAGTLAGFGTSTALAQTIGTDLGHTGANFDDLLSGDATLATDVTQAGADLANMQQLGDGREIGVEARPAWPAVRTAMTSCRGAWWREQAAGEVVDRRRPDRQRDGAE
jgi:hypothetical protein